jgi:hypothetical protein
MPVLGVGVFRRPRPEVGPVSRPAPVEEKAARRMRRIAAWDLRGARRVARRSVCFGLSPKWGPGEVCGIGFGCADERSLRLSYGQGMQCIEVSTTGVGAPADRGEHEGPGSRVLVRVDGAEVSFEVTTAAGAWGAAGICGRRRVTLTSVASPIPGELELTRIDRRSPLTHRWLGQQPTRRP